MWLSVALIEASCMCSLEVKALLIPCNRLWSSKSLVTYHSLSSSLIQYYRIFTVPFNNRRHSSLDWNIMHIVNVKLVWNYLSFTAWSWKSHPWRLSIWWLLSSSRVVIWTVCHCLNVQCYHIEFFIMQQLC